MSVVLSADRPGLAGILGAASAQLAADMSAGMPASIRSGVTSGTSSGISLGLPTPIRENLSQRAYLRIRASLIHSELRPGQRLVLRPLAAELRLSPTPVREALLRLVSEQALTLDERGSAIVPVIGLEEFREIIDIRCDLEGRAAARAAIAATHAEIEQIGALAGSYHAAGEVNDRPAMIARNADLHRMLCRIAHAPLILRILEGIWMRIGPVYALDLEEPASTTETDVPHPHDLLLVALRARDAEGARDAIIADVRKSSHWLERSLIASR